ncbi:MAG TPA: class I SAM-dependent methyltransferase [Thermoanaerobaculia bacterium]|nr:class I SAM-dependent methyltransferase [Thermoanaerobaculia bacterium]
MLRAPAAPSHMTSVSYPADGHLACAEVDEASFWYRHRNRCLIEALEAFPPAEPLFDIGGGNGAVAMALQRDGWRVALVEPIAEGAHHARRRGVTRVICASLEECGLRDASLPSAGLFDVLEHVPDDIAFLTRLRALLARDGRLYVTVPAFTALWSTHDDLVGHMRRYDAKTLSRRVEACGFTVEHVSYFFSPLPLMIFALRTLPERLSRRVRETRITAPARRMREHASHRPWLARAIETLLRFEPRAIRRKRAIPFGSSVLLVARAS